MLLAQAQRGYLGVILDTDGNPGVLIRQIMPGSPASKSALRAGDRIMVVAGNPTLTISALALRCGDQLKARLHL